MPSGSEAVTWNGTCIVSSEYEIVSPAIPLVTLETAGGGSHWWLLGCKAVASHGNRLVRFLGPLG